MVFSQRAVDSTPVSTPAFMFVDYQEDNPQNPTSSRQKHAFVQRNYQRRKKEASIERLKSSARPFKKRLPFRFISVSDSSAEDETDKESSEPPVADEKELWQTDDFNSAIKQIAKATKMWSPSAYLSQGFVDPFSSSALPMTDNMNSYFHHFRNHTIGQCYPLDSTRMSMWWWQNAVAQPAVLQALLCSTASHQRALNAQNGVSFQYIQRSTREFFRLRGDTLKTLNGIINDPMKAVADTTTLIVASLVAIEAISASFEAVDAHTKGLKKLIHLLGGLDALDHMTASKVYQCDVISAVLKNSRPHFPLTAKWRGEILQEMKVFQSGDFLFQLHDKPEIFGTLSSLGMSFFKSSWYMELDPSMKTFLHVFRRLIQYYEMARLQPSIVMPTDNDLFVVFEHQLVSISYATEDNLNEPLRISLLIYLNMRVWHLQTFPYMAHIVETLRQSLLSRLSYLHENAPTLLFWILFIGGMASQGHKGHPWFVSHLTTITHDMGLSQWANARPVLGRFFYTDQSGEKGAEDLWNEILIKDSENYPYIAPKSVVSDVQAMLEHRDIIASTPWSSRS